MSYLLYRCTFVVNLTSIHLWEACSVLSGQLFPPSASETKSKACFSRKSSFSQRTSLYTGELSHSWWPPGGSFPVWILKPFLYPAAEWASWRLQQESHVSFSSLTASLWPFRLPPITVKESLIFCLCLYPLEFFLELLSNTPFISICSSVKLHKSSSSKHGSAADGHMIQIMIPRKVSV